MKTKTIKKTKPVRAYEVPGKVFYQTDSRGYVYVQDYCYVRETIRTEAIIYCVSMN